MGLFIPIAGWVERGYIGVFGAFFLFALIKGFVHIRAKQVASHREWMIRAFAIALAVATQRVIFVPALIVAGTETQGQVSMLLAMSFMAAFVVHASVAEIWIRLTRRRSVPWVSGTETASDPIPDSG